MNKKKYNYKENTSIKKEQLPYCHQMVGSGLLCKWCLGVGCNIKTICGFTKLHYIK